MERERDRKARRAEERKLAKRNQREEIQPDQPIPLGDDQMFHFAIGWREFPNRRQTSSN